MLYFTIIWQQLQYAIKKVGTLPGGRIITDYHTNEAFSLVKYIRRYV